MKMLNDLPMEDRLIWYKPKNKTLSILYDDETQLIEKTFKNSITFNMSGWSYSDDDAQESDSGITISDFFNHETELKEKLMKILNKNIVIHLNVNS